jgi:hypothetical protein
VELEFFTRALFDDDAATPLKFRPPDFWRKLPQRFADELCGGRAEDLLRRGVESCATPAAIEREETFAHALEQRLNEGFLTGAACSRNLLSIRRRRHPQRNRAQLVYNAYYAQSHKR